MLCLLLETSPFPPQTKKKLPAQLPNPWHRSKYTSLFVVQVILPPKWLHAAGETPHMYALYSYRADLPVAEPLTTQPQFATGGPDHGAANLTDYSCVCLRQHEQAGELKTEFKDAYMTLCQGGLPQQVSLPAKASEYTLHTHPAYTTEDN